MTRIIPVCLAAAAAGCVFNRVEIPLGGSLRAYDEKTVSAEPRAEGKIAMIDLEGILTSDHHESIFGIKEPAAAAFVEKLKKAEEDPGVKAVIVRIDSPGGDVTTSDILHNELKSFKERTRRPAVACFMGLATSGGYYVAGACDRIVAHPTSITGSIGVIALHVSLSGLMDKIGVKATALKSGARKDAGSPFRDLTEEDRGLLQSLVDQAHERFIRVVAEGRRGRLMEAEVRAAADGRVFTARQALDAKLVDRVGYLKDALEEAKSLAGIRAAELVMYSRRPQRMENPYSVNASSTGAPAWELEMARRLLGFRLYYIWEPYVLGR